MNTFPASIPVESPLPRAGVNRSRTGSLRLTSTLAGLALGVLVVMSLALVLAAARGSSFLTPTTQLRFFPGWMAGPLAGLWSGFPEEPGALSHLVNFGLLGMFACYVAAWRWAPELRARWTVTAIVLVHLIFFLSPPLEYTDVFNYINYARMGVLYHLNPYATIPALEPFTDASYALSNWHHLMSPYGPLFTLMMYAIVPLGVAASFWLIKLMVCLSSLAMLGLLWRCAEMLGRSPVRVVVFAGLNPVVLLWGLGGDHYDFLLMFVIVLGVYLVLRSEAARGRLAHASLPNALVPGRWFARAEQGSGAGERVAPRTCAWPHRSGRVRHVVAGVDADRLRDWGIGAAFVSAVAIKASAGLLLPIVLAGVGRGRRLRVATAMALTAVALAVASYLAFGARLPNLSEQSTLVMNVGPANILGVVLGLGGDTAGLREVLFALTVGAAIVGTYWAWTGRRSWIAVAGVATFVLVLTLSWTAPWYVLWILPFAALAQSERVRYAVLALSVYFILSFSPMASGVLNLVHIHPGSTAFGQREVVIFNELVH